MTEIRLACVYCDDDSCDGVAEIPDGWEDVEVVDTGKQEDSDWWTHLGTCPGCARGGQEECRRIDAADAARWRKVLGQLAVYGGNHPSNDHVWHFRHIKGPHSNLNDAIDAL